MNALIRRRLFPRADAQRVVAEGARVTHPVILPTRMSMKRRMDLAVKRALAPEAMTAADWAARGYRSCITDRGATYCRCGAYALEWT